MAMATGGKGPQADINVTPLVDIVLVLLIIFMVITPMLQRGAEVKLPQIKNSESKEDSQDDVIITVDKDGAFFYGEDLITLELLQTELERTLLAEPFKPVLIKGDVATPYGEVRKVMALCEKVGAKSVSLMTENNDDSLPAKDEEGS